jgi:hypothetical protein
MVPAIQDDLERTERSSADADARFRADFLRAVWRIGLEYASAVAVVEACTGRPFAACGACELLPVLGNLLALLRSTATTRNARTM